jgi:uncharacterized protein
LLNSDAIYTVSPDLILREVGEHLVLVSIAFESKSPVLDIFTTSSTGRAILAKLDGIKNIENVIKELTADYQTSFTEVEHDVKAFIEDLESKQVLVRGKTAVPTVSLQGQPDSRLKFTQQQATEDTKRQLGWAYHQLKWPNSNEIPRLSKDRDLLAESLSRHIDWSCFQNKIHYGPLSPGCVCCGEGTWHCLFVNKSCTASCFYCPQDRKNTAENLPILDEMAFRGPDDFSSFVAEVGAKGISFSGGEPLLFFPALIDYITAIRQKLGGNVYLWMYTNGHLIERHKLAELKKAGLDEIRVDIAASDYSLAAAKLAREYFENVSIEIPAIPEDIEKVKSAMASMIGCGIRYLNLHQLLTTEHNYRALAARNYTFLHHPGIPVYESEITVLKLLNYAISEHLPLQINYCSQSYKERIQSKNRRLKALPFVITDCEEATEKMYIRLITIKAAQAEMSRYVKVLTQSGHPASTWKIQDHPAGLVITPLLLPCFKGEDCRFTLTYYQPYLSGCQCADGDQGLGGVFQKDPPIGERGFVADRYTLAEYCELSQLFMQSFYRLVVQKQTWAETVTWFILNYPVENIDDINRMAGDLDTLKNVMYWERVETGLPEIY